MRNPAPLGRDAAGGAPGRADRRARGRLQLPGAAHRGPHHPPPQRRLQVRQPGVGRPRLQLQPEAERRRAPRPPHHPPGRVAPHPHPHRAAARRLHRRHHRGPLRRQPRHLHANHRSQVCVKYKLA